MGRYACLPEVIDSICRWMEKGRNGTAGPGDSQGVDAGNGTEANDLFVVYGRLETPAGDQFPIEYRTGAVDADLTADGEGVGTFPLQGYTDIMVLVQLAAVVAIYRCGSVLVVDDQIEIAVAVEVAIGGSVGERRLGKSPGSGDVFELEMAGISKYFIDQRMGRHFIQDRI